MRNKSILIQNYHPPATTALVRDFKKIGFEVLSPDSDWGRFNWYAPNDGIGSALISESEYFSRPPGYVLITCKPAEESLKRVAREHGDLMILNVAQQYQVYEDGIADVMICPDTETFKNYPHYVEHKLLYFVQPHISDITPKDHASSYAKKSISSFVSTPHVWPIASEVFAAFARLYPHHYVNYGLEAPGGYVDHATANRIMVENFFTAQFKDHEAYGLACLESMMLGTPIVTLKRFIEGKTLGEFFLMPDNSIIADTVEEAVEKLLSISFEDYLRLSENGKARAYEMTSDERTVEVLKRVLG
ncbi:hypothetical protein LNAOJCKE_4517 [Methylorubrum aminovorans]|uniref:Glycosyltransferase n=2 Tax=Methylorubrum aminovorans TaxID=269069 RepID=A0ABQ4UKG0_9HYPH|nr:hypothetical protein LNAOJCKE_4517 [Methylorubrum aminovorans]